MEIESASTVAAAVPGCDEYIFFAKTSQSHIIAKLFESLNANVNDINLWIGGGTITAICTDASQQRTTHLRLDSKGFDAWYVQPGARVLVGINIPLLFKLVKDSIKAQNPLSIYIKKDTQRFFVRVDKQKASAASAAVAASAGAGGGGGGSDVCVPTGGYDDSSVPILQLPPQVPQLPTASYKTMVSMNSHTFLQICKTCQHTMTERIRISTDIAEKKLVIQSEGVHNPADKRVSLTESDGDVIFRSSGPSNFTALFTLRLCHEIAKSTTLSDHVHFYMEPGQPLVAQFDAGNLGCLKFYLQARDED
jgi:hypothetical protein